MSCIKGVPNPIFKLVYLLPNSQKKYIFTGKVDEKLRIVFNKIEKRYELTSKEEGLVKKKFGKQYRKNLNFSSPVKFIDDFIYTDDTIHTIRNKAFVHISRFENYLIPENLHLYLQTNEGGNIILGDSYTKEGRSKRFDSVD